MLSVDHIRPWRSFENKEAANALDNLASLCKWCHAWKTLVVEPAWLKGDMIAYKQYLEAIAVNESDEAARQ